MFQDRIINNGIKTLNIPWWFEIAVFSVSSSPFLIFGFIVPKLITIFIKQKQVILVLIVLSFISNIIVFIWFNLLNFSPNFKPDLFIISYLTLIIGALFFWNYWLVKQIYKRK